MILCAGCGTPLEDTSREYALCPKCEESIVKEMAYNGEAEETSDSRGRRYPGV